MNIEIAPKETEIRANWDDAMMYCQFLEVDGKTDWRLPTKEELDYIHKSENDFIGSYYWSSTAYDSLHAWSQDLLNGFKNTYHMGNSYRVRAVRDIK